MSRPEAWARGRGLEGSARQWGTLILVGIAASLVSARLTPFALALAAIAVIGAQWSASKFNSAERQPIPSPGRVAAALAVFIAYCLATTLWSEAGGKAASKLALVALIATAGLVVPQLYLAAQPPMVRRAAEGLAIGFAIGLAFLLVELLSGQAIQIAIYNTLDLPHVWLQPERHFTWEADKLVAIEPAHINRSLAVCSLLAFPAALAIFALAAPSWRKAGALIVIAGAVAAAMCSRHESSVAAMLAGLLVFAVSLRWAGWARRIVGLGWVLACLGVLPLVLTAHKLDLHRVGWLHHSMQHRLVIWNTTAEETMKAPVLGIGAYMTYLLMPERNKAAELEQGLEYKKTFSRHAHNVYLQTWFELGAVGALLLALCGVAVVMALAALPVAAQPYALATFATAATMMSSSYGMWQSWYVALFALAAVAVAIGVRALEQSRPDSDQR